jgi:predicted component of type VI protein secretion system
MAQTASAVQRYLAAPSTLTERLATSEAAQQAANRLPDLRQALNSIEIQLKELGLLPVVPRDGNNGQQMPDDPLLAELRRMTRRPL